MIIRTLLRRQLLATFSQSHRAMTTSSQPKKPVIFILGATGTGKSDLAIQIANHISNQCLPDSSTACSSGEIINADAMQLYRGLPIITNKVTLEGQQGVPHHLLDHIDLEEEPWTVQQYVKEADLVITDLYKRQKVPIVVGGTSYYVYGLLFKGAMLEETTRGNKDPDNNNNDKAQFGKDAALIWPILDASTPEIYAELQKVDPEQAMKWHPNDRRKIQRSLEIYLRSGRKASDIYEDQKQSSHLLTTHVDDTNVEGEETNAGGSEMLRYDPLIFWLDAEDEALKERLNRRVDTMVERGLLAETQQLANFEEEMQRKSVSIDKSKGIWVSIGHKEMEPWIHCLHDGAQPKETEILKSDCIEAVKAGTRQYAKRQNRFIRIRLANALAKAKVTNKLFLLDCTDPENWSCHVYSHASTIVDAFLQGADLPLPSTLSQLAHETFASMSQRENVSDRIARKCETCDKVLMTEKQWNNHLNSRSHKKLLESIRKRGMPEPKKTNNSCNC